MTRDRRGNTSDAIVPRFVAGYIFENQVGTKEVAFEGPTFLFRMIRECSWETYETTRTVSADQVVLPLYTRFVPRDHSA